MGKEIEPDKSNPDDTHPIEDLLEKLGTLLNFMESKKEVPINEVIAADPGLQEKMKEIEQMVIQFQKLSDQIVALSGISLEELLKRRAGKSNEVPPEGRRLIEKSNKVRLQAENLASSHDVEAPTSSGLPPSSQKSEFEKIKESKDTKFGKKRRGKFKHMGGDKDWKPL